MSTVSVALLLAGCGSYDQPKPAAGGSSGQGGSGAMAGMGGTGAMGGTGGGDAGSGQGGSGGSGGSAEGGSGGAAGGGQAGVGAGGSGGDGGSGGGSMEVPCPMPVPDATPCGGDVTGTWAVASCPLTITGELDLSDFGLGCHTGTVTSGSLQVTGTWTADGQGMYTDNTRTTGEQVVELPEECLMVSGFVTDCARLGGEGGTVTDALKYATLECVNNPTTMGCTCTGTFDKSGGLAFINQATQPLTSGTYTTSDNKLVTAAEQATAGQANTEYSYCVMESTMVLTLTSVAKTGTVMGPIVLQKQ